MRLQKYVNFGVHVIYGGISFLGVALILPTTRHVRFLLVCQPCNDYLLPVNVFRSQAFLREEGGPFAVEGAHETFAFPPASFQLLHFGGALPLSLASSRQLSPGGNLSYKNSTLVILLLTTHRLSLF